MDNDVDHLRDTSRIDDRIGNRGCQGQKALEQDDPQDHIEYACFFGVAPPIRIAAMAGNAIINGAE